MGASIVNFVGADHPSLDHELDVFVTGLRSEQRFFGPTQRSDPKPFPSLVRALRGRAGFRVAAVEAGRVIGLAAVDEAGDVAMAVAADRRGWGIGAALGRASLRQARSLGYSRLVIRSTRRTWAVRRIGEQLGCTVVDVDHGRTELILDLGQDRRSA